MPIPFLVSVLGAAAGIIGAGGHLSAKETNEIAQKIADEAKALYENSKNSLEEAQKTTEIRLVKLAYSKKYVLETSMKQFVESYEKIKDIELIMSSGLNELSKFSIDQQDIVELRKLTDIYESSVESGVAGAAAGAAIALAAGGEIGIAATGSTLTMGAAVTPLATLVAPIVLFTGISASMKADENLEKAKTTYAEAEAASEKMKISETICGAITERSDMFCGLLVDLNEMFAECTALLAGVIKKKEGKFFKKKLTASDLNEKEIQLIAITRALAGAVKSVIDTPMLSNDGTISYEGSQMYDNVSEKLLEFKNEVTEIQQIDFKAKPVEIQSGAKTKQYNRKGAAILRGIRNVFAFVLGFMAATLFVWDIAKTITTYNEKVLFMDSYTANCIAVWIIIFCCVMMFIGKFHETKMEKICFMLTGIALALLFAEYCRTMLQRERYIVISIVVVLAGAFLCIIFEANEWKWNSATYFGRLCSGVSMMMVVFLLYAFLVCFIGLPANICLNILTVVALVLGISNMLEGDSE